MTVISKLRASYAIVGNGCDNTRIQESVSRKLSGSSVRSYLGGCLSLCVAGLTLVQGSVLAADTAVNAVSRPGSEHYRQDILKIAQAQPEDGASFPSGGSGQRPFERRRWPGKAFPGGGEPGQVGELETGVPGRFERPSGPGGFEGPADGGDGGGFNGPGGPGGGPGGFYGRRGAGRFGPGRPGGFRRKGALTPGGKMFGGPLDLTRLGLSEEQKDKIRQTRMQSAKKARELRREVRMRQAEMKDLMFDPDASEAQIKSKRRAIRDMQDQLEDVIIGDFLSLRAVLTPEQRKRLPEVRPDARLPAMGPGPTSPGGSQAGFRSGGFPPAGAPRRFGGPQSGPADGPVD